MIVGMRVMSFVVHVTTGLFNLTKTQVVSVLKIFWGKKKAPRLAKGLIYACFCALYFWQ
jgi:hypothetical protein